MSKRTGEKFSILKTVELAWPRDEDAEKLLPRAWSYLFERHREVHVCVERAGKTLTHVVIRVPR